jgi:hypothetical protein
MSVYCWVPNHDSSEQPLQAPPVLSSANTHPAAADGSAAAAAAAVRVAPATSSNAGGVESGSCGAGASAVKVIVGVSTHTDSGDAATEPRNRHALVCADGSVYASRTVGWDIDRWGPLVEVAGIAEQGGATQFTFFALPEVMLCVTREGRLITRGEFQGPCKYLGRPCGAGSELWLARGAQRCPGHFNRFYARCSDSTRRVPVHMGWQFDGAARTWCSRRWPTRWS